MSKHPKNPIMVDFNDHIANIEGKMELDFRELLSMIDPTSEHRDFERQMFMLRQIQASKRLLDVMIGETDIYGNVRTVPASHTGLPPATSIRENLLGSLGAAMDRVDAEERQ